MLIMPDVQSVCRTCRGTNGQIRTFNELDGGIVASIEVGFCAHICNCPDQLSLTLVLTAHFGDLVCTLKKGPREEFSRNHIETVPSL